MDINTVIEIERFGDFDIKYTECIMVSPQKFNINNIMQDFYNIMDIKSNSGLDNETLRTINDEFISYLELNGFVKLKTNKVMFYD